MLHGLQKLSKTSVLFNSAQSTWIEMKGGLYFKGQNSVWLSWLIICLPPHFS